MSRYYIGLMSGTSVDAVDAVLMDFEISNHHIVAHYALPISSELRKTINAVIASRQFPENIQTVDEEFAHTSYESIKNLLKTASVEAREIVAIGSHGQTVFHDPKGIPPISIQIGNPQIIANLSGIPTIGNFRQADIDAGGQGAPLACAYHAEVLQSHEEERVILNLGGIANITKLPSDSNEPIIGFDTGPANTLMDAWAQKHLNVPYDKDGEWARSGNVNKPLLEHMLEDSYFMTFPPKSTGREHFNLEWLQHHLDTLETLPSPADIQATLLALTTYTIADNIDAWCPHSKKVLLCGGGSENKFLVEELKKILDEVCVKYTSEYGVPTKSMEPMAFAWLAKQHIENKPGNIPSVTGADKPVILGEKYQVL